MDTLSAYARSQAAGDVPHKVFDWNRAAQIIRDKKPGMVEAGLSLDMEWTGGVIYQDGKVVTESYTFLSSNWATPVIVLDEGDEMPCWCYSNDWDEHTKWPQSALDILNGATDGPTKA